MTRYLGRFLALAAFTAAVFTAGVYYGSENSTAAAAGSRFFELRTYTTPEGRLDDLNARFRDHTNRIFKKHGMDLVGYWTPAEGPESKNTLVYILGYPNKEAREKSWAGFRDDPEWKKVNAETSKNGKIVDHVDSKLLVPTDYSPIQ